MNVRKFLITGLGTGYLRPAPGTWGAAMVAGAYLLLWPVIGWGGMQALLAGLVLLWSVVCVVLGGYAEQVFGHKDPGRVSADEWAGQALALVALPWPHNWREALIVAGLAFAAFRLMDIIKPSPANRLQRLRHGWGILVDDLVAGAYANIICQVILRVWVM